MAPAGKRAETCESEEAEVTRAALSARQQDLFQGPRHCEGTNLAFFLPTPGTEVFPIHSPLQILFPPKSLPH